MNLLITNSYFFEFSKHDFPIDATDTKDLQDQLRVKEKEIDSLKTEINKIQSSSNTTLIENEADIKQLESLNDQLTSKIELLEIKLGTMLDYEAIKKDLSILRR